jgi:hypothetical protein
VLREEASVRFKAFAANAAAHAETHATPPQGGFPISGATETPLDLEALTQDLVEAHTAQLRQCVEQAAAGVFLLIDPMLGDPVLAEAPPAEMPLAALDELRTQAWERPTHALTLPKRLKMDSAFAPYLVELQGPVDRWLEVSVQWAVQEALQAWTVAPGDPVPHRVGGWLQSAALGPRVAEHLSGWLRLSAPRYADASYLRLADRRVLGLALHVLGQDLVAQALYPVQCWHWLDPQAAWHTLKAQGGPAKAAGESDASTPLATFNVAQWQRMLLGPRVHSLMAKAIGLHLRQPGAVAPMPWPPVSEAQWQAALSELEGLGQPIQQEDPS